MCVKGEKKCFLILKLKHCVNDGLHDVTWRITSQDLYNIIKWLNHHQRDAVVKKGNHQKDMKMGVRSLFYFTLFYH